MPNRLIYEPESEDFDSSIFEEIEITPNLYLEHQSIEQIKKWNSEGRRVVKPMWRGWRTDKSLEIWNLRPGDVVVYIDESGCGKPYICQENIISKVETDATI